MSRCCNSKKCVKGSLCVRGDLKVKGNSQFCSDVKVGGDLTVNGSITADVLTVGEIVLKDNGCQEVVVTKSTHPLVGWWLNVNKGATSSTDVLWKIRCEEGGKLFAHLYAGYQGRYREWTPEDAVNADGGLWGLWDYTLPVNDFPLVPVESNPKGFYCNPTLPSNPEFLSKQQITAAQLNMTDDPNVCYTFMIGMQSPVGFGAYGGDTLKLVRLDYEPVIEKYENPAYIDTTNPVKIFEDIFNTFYKIGNNQFTKEAQTKDYPGFAAMNQRYHELLTTGVTYTNTVKDVWRSRIDNPTGFVLPISTTLVVEDFPNPRVGARVYCTGFLGDYEILNNPDGFELGIADNNNGRVAASVLGPEYYDGANEKFLLTFLDLNTSDLPPYDPAIHGVGKTKLVIKPVTPATEYSELVAAVHDLYSFTGRHTHKVFRPYRDRTTLRIYKTFQDLQDGLNINRAVRIPIQPRGRAVTRASANYVDYSYISGSTVPAIPSNDPTGMNLNDPKFEHSIDINNYYDPENTYNIYWALDGPEIPGAPVTGQRLLDVSEALVGPYYKNPGSKFIFTVSKFGEAPADPKWSIYGDYEPILLFGLLDINKTCGEKVGFISLLDNYGIDGTFWASLFEDFSPGVPSSMGPLGDCFATVMEKINSFGVDKLIIDDRGNIGGLETVVGALASFIGAKRPAQSFVIGFADNGNQPFERLQTIQNRANFIGMQNFINNSGTLFNDIFAVKYPNSMFKGTADKPKRVIFLTDINAGSAGDDNPHYFRNTLADDPSDLGDYVYCDIVGDIDGRVISGSTYPLSQFTNVSHNLMRNGNAVSSILLGLEGGAATAFIVKDGKIEYGSNQIPSIKPKVLLNGDIEATFWLDTGYKGTYPLNPADGGSDSLVLPLSTGVTQPNKDDPTTWRDRFLEAAITSLVDCSKEFIRVEKSKKIVQRKLVKYQHKEEEDIKGPTRRLRF